MTTWDDDLRAATDALLGADKRIPVLRLRVWLPLPDGTGRLYNLDEVEIWLGVWERYYERKACDEITLTHY